MSRADFDRMMRLASEKRDGEAMYYVAISYLYGVNIKQDYFEAVWWLEHAAGPDYNLPKAQIELGRCYENGWSVEKSYSMAQSWYRKAYKIGGDPDGLAEEGRLLIDVEREYRDGVAILLEAAEKHSAMACAYLGTVYEEGIWVEQNKEKAMDFFSKAASLGDVDSMLKVGKMYLENHSYLLARSFLGMAVNAGVKEAKPLFRQADAGFKKQGY